MKLDQTDQLSWISNLYRLGQGVAPGIDINEAYQRILDHVVQGLGGQSGTLALVDESIVFFDDGEMLVIAASNRVPTIMLGDKIPFGQGVLGWVAQHGNNLLLNGDLSNDARFQGQLLNRQDRPASAMCWALKSEGRLIGVLSINRTQEFPPYTETELDKGITISGLISMVIDNIRLNLVNQQNLALLSNINKDLISTGQRLGEAQSHLLQADKMASVGQLAAGVAHEINNPIGYVYSNLGTLEKYVQNTFSLLDQYELAENSITDAAVLAKLKAAKDQLDIAYLKEDLRTLMAESKDGITRVKSIVQNLKDFSHVDATDEWHYADLHAGLNSTLNIVNNEIKYKAEVVREFGQIPQVECLASQLNQVFMNLLVNASHAIEEHGTITVRTGTAQDEVWVEVRDSGKGIPPENIKKIFDPFFTTKPIGKGTGLGLSLSYGIIQKHHGRIEVQSEVGKGTTFKVWLPVKHAGSTQLT